ncbi:hypothetical protein GQ55_3G115600 [Panicum hallii var. hallii]|uniref:Uncharacterized protein n=1 Tax=Panicum hallii var. hallii TaxID=1504633 RepID=A0A2T7E8C8_9POAL|nr:hypothetical protein GQ55_3G115600 [Panicum hallii var. hallii]
MEANPYRAIYTTPHQMDGQLSTSMVPCLNFGSSSGSILYRFATKNDHQSIKIPPSDPQVLLELVSTSWSFCLILGRYIPQKKWVQISRISAVCWKLVRNE